VYDEPQPSIYGNYANAHTRAWADKIAGFDGYVFVTPEYNRSIPGPERTPLRSGLIRPVGT
jgi:NAD(P)H-dependent FMN reductase